MASLTLNFVRNRQFLFGQIYNFKNCVMNKYNFSFLSFSENVKRKYKHAKEYKSTSSVEIRPCAIRSNHLALKTAIESNTVTPIMAQNTTAIPASTFKQKVNALRTAQIAMIHESGNASDVSTDCLGTPSTKLSSDDSSICRLSDDEGDDVSTNQKKRNLHRISITVPVPMLNCKLE